MSDLKSSDSPQVKFVHEWNQAVRNGDLDFLAKSIPKDYRNTFYPRSLGVPDQTKEEFLEYIGGFFNLWTEWEVTVNFIAEAPGKVIFHSTNKAKTSVGVDIVRESIFVKHVVTDEDGSMKIKLGEEFTDSKAYLDAIQAVAAAKAKRQ